MNKGKTMLLINHIDPETKRRQALAKVYNLLIRLAENNTQPQESESQKNLINPKKCSLITQTHSKRKQEENNER